MGNQSSSDFIAQYAEGPLKDADIPVIFKRYDTDFDTILHKDDIKNLLQDIQQFVHERKSKVNKSPAGGATAANAGVADPIADTEVNMIFSMIDLHKTGNIDIDLFKAYYVGERLVPPLETAKSEDNSALASNIASARVQAVTEEMDSLEAETKRSPAIVTASTDGSVASLAPLVVDDAYTTMARDVITRGLDAQKWSPELLTNVLIMSRYMIKTATDASITTGGGGVTKDLHRDTKAKYSLFLSEFNRCLRAKLCRIKEKLGRVQAALDSVTIIAAASATPTLVSTTATTTTTAAKTDAITQPPPSKPGLPGLELLKGQWEKERDGLAQQLHCESGTQSRATAVAEATAKEDAARQSWLGSMALAPLDTAMRFSEMPIADALMTAAIRTFLPVFRESWRRLLVLRSWHSKIIAMDLPCSNRFSLHQSLVKVRRFIEERTRTLQASINTCDSSIIEHLLTDEQSAQAQLKNQPMIDLLDQRELLSTKHDKALSEILILDGEIALSSYGSRQVCAPSTGSGSIAKLPPPSVRYLMTSSGGVLFGLYVKVVEVMGVVLAEDKSEPDTYISLSCGQLAVKTRTEWGSCDPVFNDEYYFDVMDKEANLTVSLFSRHYLFDSHLGHILIPVTALLEHGYQDVWLPFHLGDHEDHTGGRRCRCVGQEMAIHIVLHATTVQGSALSGYLLQQDSVISKWVKRYVVVKDTAMITFDKDDDPSPRDIVPLDQCTLGPDRFSKLLQTFRLKHPCGRQWVFAAETKEEYKKWMDGLWQIMTNIVDRFVRVSFITPADPSIRRMSWVLPFEKVAIDHLRMVHLRDWATRTNQDGIARQISYCLDVESFTKIPAAQQLRRAKDIFEIYLSSSAPHKLQGCDGDAMTNVLDYRSWRGAADVSRRLEALRDVLLAEIRDVVYPMFLQSGDGESVWAAKAFIGSGVVGGNCRTLLVADATVTAMGDASEAFLPHDGGEGHAAEAKAGEETLSVVGNEEKAESDDGGVGAETDDSGTTLTLPVSEPPEPPPVAPEPVAPPVAPQSEAPPGSPEPPPVAPEPASDAAPVAAPRAKIGNPVVLNAARHVAMSKNPI